MDEALVSLLRDLGMSEYEAKTLYALFRLREGDAKTISEHAGVPRTKVYEILEEFVRDGYVTELDTRPRRYVVADPIRVLRLIIKEKKEGLERIEKRLETIGKLIPVLSENEEITGNYILRFKRPETLVGIIGDETDEKTIIGVTPKSSDILHRLNGKHVKSPFDFILTGKAVYIPLAPLGEPARETTVVVFQDPNIVDVFRRWLNERGV
ncbi:MAG: HTH-type transcriptional regulator, sugar sensing transcriptional regulator [Candidatus Diapherotrites archaeon]|nr:HTH-type transcriptional regulator, sugar sensing transcriptional regulator [Candidatus Diapherotrites archaeon]